MTWPISKEGAKLQHLPHIKHAITAVFHEKTGYGFAWLQIAAQFGHADAAKVVTMLAAYVSATIICFPLTHFMKHVTPFTIFATG